MDVVAVQQLREFGGVHHVGADVVIGHRQLVGQVDHLRAVGAGEGDQDLQVDGHAEHLRQGGDALVHPGLAVGDQVDGLHQRAEFVAAGEAVESYPVVLGTLHHGGGGLVDLVLVGLLGVERVDLQRQFITLLDDGLQQLLLVGAAAAGHGLGEVDDLYRALEALQLFFDLFPYLVGHQLGHGSLALSFCWRPILFYKPRQGLY